MYAQVEKPKENRSKVVANSAAQLNDNRQQGSGFDDNRPETVVQWQLQELANRAPQAGWTTQMRHMARQHVTGGSKPNAQAVVQPKVIIKNDPYTYETGTKRMHNAGKNPQHTFVPDAPANANDWAGDPWLRQYGSVKEFQDHSGDSPVDVGLAKRIGSWYRLPFSQGFYVLGENHAELGIETVVDESNQKGKVLGEKETLDYKGVGINKPLKERNSTIPGVSLFTMESMPAKALFAASALKGLLGALPTLLTHGLPTQVWVTLHDDSKERTDVISQNEAGWLSAYKAAATKDRGYQGRIPLYRNTSREWVKANLPDSSSEDTYSFVDKVRTYLGLVVTIVDAMKKITGAEVTANRMEASYLELNKKLTAKTLTALDTDLNSLITDLTVVAEAEITAPGSLKSQGGEDWTVKGREKAAVGSGGLAGVGPMALRDLAMLASIVAAHNSGDFIVAGIGDAHAKNLKPSLTKENITTVTLADRDLEKAI
jgi:hypothetical protein